VTRWWKRISTWLTGGTPTEQTPNTVPLQGYTHDLAYFHELFKHAPDFTVREFKLGLAGTNLAALYLRSLADEVRIATEVILPLTSIRRYLILLPEVIARTQSAIS